MLLEKVFYDCDWCMYKHGGSNGKQEHFHVCVPGGNAERTRKRLKSAVGGGQKFYSVKSFYNAYSCFVFYCEHEGSAAEFKSQEEVKWGEIIETVKRDGVYKKRSIESHMVPRDVKNKERDWTLTYSNLVCQAVAWQRKHLKDCDSLKAVVKHMIAHSRWIPSKELVSKGVPEFYQRLYEFRIGLRSEPDMDWWTPKQF